MIVFIQRILRIGTIKNSKKKVTMKVDPICDFLFLKLSSAYPPKNDKCYSVSFTSVKFIPRNYIYSAELKGSQLCAAFNCVSTVHEFY